MNDFQLCVYSVIKHWANLQLTPLLNNCFIITVFALHARLSPPNYFNITQHWPLLFPLLCEFRNTVVARSSGKVMHSGIWAVAFAHMRTSNHRTAVLTFNIHCSICLLFPLPHFLLWLSLSLIGSCVPLFLNWPHLSSFLLFTLFISGIGNH